MLTRLFKDRSLPTLQNPGVTKDGRLVSNARGLSMYSIYASTAGCISLYLSALLVTYHVGYCE